ncbi:hypothetical protein B0H11DRAFT_848174 [Mycena galericulata]|nr:hypothetical protein B0H11DRAFT_848174 [Mycena galericulata]
MTHNSYARPAPAGIWVCAQPSRLHHVDIRKFRITHVATDFASGPSEVYIAVACCPAPVSTPTSARATLSSPHTRFECTRDPCALMGHPRVPSRLPIHFRISTSTPAPAPAPGVCLFQLNSTRQAGADVRQTDGVPTMHPGPDPFLISDSLLTPSSASLPTSQPLPPAPASRPFFENPTRSAIRVPEKNLIASTRHAHCILFCARSSQSTASSLTSHTPQCTMERAACGA